MSNNYIIKGKFANFKYGLISFFKKNYITLIIICVLILLGIFTGVFTAIKFDKLDCLTTDYLIYDFIKDELLTGGVFFNRLFSAEVIMVIISVCSFTIFTIPISILILVYRAYLIGFNCVILFVFYGLGGTVTCIIAIIPCQIIMLLLLVVFQVLLLNRLSEKRKYKLSKCGNKNRFWFVFIIFSLLLLLICIIETLLIFLIKSSTILSI